MDSFTEFTDLSGVVVNSEGGRTWFEFRGLVFQCIGVFACSTKDNGQSCMTQCLTTEINGQTISAGYSQTDLVLDLDANSWSFDSNNFSLHLVGQVVELINQEDVVGQQAAVKELDRVLSAYGVVSGVCTEETEEFVLIGSDDQPLVLVTGPTGSGKTTLLDSIMRAQATREDGRHILTFYAPIENDLNQIPDITGIISQCEIGKPGYGANIRSFPEAVANALRRHPNVVLKR